MSIYNIPYTYLIGWSKHNIWYYGCRYSKKCHPNDLWKTYFTSSKYVNQARKTYGEPDVILVRKTFDSVQKAQIWEHKVLKRLKVVSESKWLNKTDNKTIDYHGMKRNTLPGSRAAAEKKKGKKFEELFSLEEANRLKQICKENGIRVWQNPELRERMKKKPADRTKYKEAALKRWSNPEDRANRCKNMKGSKQRKRSSHIDPSLNGSTEEKSTNKSDSCCISSLSAAGIKSLTEEFSKVR